MQYSQHRTITLVSHDRIKMPSWNVWPPFSIVCVPIVAYYQRILKIVWILFPALSDCYLNVVFLAQLVKYILCNVGNMSWATNTLVKNQSWWPQGLLASQPSLLSEPQVWWHTMSWIDSEKPLRNGTWGWTLSSTHTCAHVHVLLTPSHSHRRAWSLL